MFSLKFTSVCVCKREKMERERGKREKEKVQERLKENTVVASRRSRREKKQDAYWRRKNQHYVEC